jgi:hypothetical protein
MKTWVRRPALTLIGAAAIAPARKRLIRPASSLLRRFSALQLRCRSPRSVLPGRRTLSQRDAATPRASARWTGRYSRSSRFPRASRGRLSSSAVSPAPRPTSTTGPTAHHSPASSRARRRLRRRKSLPPPWWRWASSCSPPGGSAEIAWRPGRRPGRFPPSLPPAEPFWPPDGAVSGRPSRKPPLRAALCVVAASPGSSRCLLLCIAKLPE